MQSFHSYSGPGGGPPPGSGYPPPHGGGFPPPPGGGGYPPPPGGGGYPPPGGGYPHPPGGGGYPPAGGGYWPPPGGGYPPPGGGYPPPGGGYPPPGGGHPPGRGHQLHNAPPGHGNPGHQGQFPQPHAAQPPSSAHHAQGGYGPPGGYPPNAGGGSAGPGGPAGWDQRGYAQQQGSGGYPPQQAGAGGYDPQDPYARGQYGGQEYQQQVQSAQEQTAQQASAGSAPPPNTAVRVLYDYVASEKGVLSLRAGEVCTMMEHKEQGWCTLKTAAGQEGYFPLSYVELAGNTAVETSSGNTSQTNMRCSLHGKVRSAGNLISEPDPLVVGGVRWVCKAGCECKGTGAFPTGIAAAAVHPNPTIGPSVPTSFTGGGPVAGRGVPVAGAATGGGVFVPGQASQQMMAFSGAGGGQPAAAPQPRAPLPPNAAAVRMQVMKDYEGKDPGVLTMKAGDVCDLIKPEANGWNLVRSPAGQAGFFPAAYVKPKNDVDAEKARAAIAAATAGMQAGSAAPQGEGEGTVANGKAEEEGKRQIGTGDGQEDKKEGEPVKTEVEAGGSEAGQKRPREEAEGEPGTEAKKEKVEEAREAAASKEEPPAASAE